MINLFQYKHIDNNSNQTLFILHGTGGTENDFLFLDDLLSKKYNIVSLKGNVDENGMARFFKRKGFGIFDIEDIKIESEKLNQFITNWKSEHKSERLNFLGYSNGANMILAQMFLYSKSINTAVLLHPMLPFSPEINSLENTNIFVSFGTNDQMVTADQSLEVIDKLKSLNAKVEAHEYNAGHQITDNEVDDVVNYLDSN